MDSFWVVYQTATPSDGGNTLDMTDSLLQRNTNIMMERVVFYTAAKAGIYVVHPSKKNAFAKQNGNPYL